MAKMRKKKQNLSPEEKKILLAQRKRHQKEAKLEKKRQLIRNELTRELKMGAINKKKIDAKWTSLLYKLKQNDMAIEFKKCLNSYDKSVDAKDLIISYLLDELQESVLQQENNFKAHCERVDEILGVYHQRISDLQDEYNKFVDDIKTSLDEERQYRELKEQEEDDYLNMVEFGYQTLKKQNELDYTIRRFRYLEELDTKSHNESNLFTNSVLNKFFVIWTVYTDIFNKYENGIASKKKSYHQTLINDGAVMEVIKMQRSQLFLLYLKFKKVKDMQIEDKEKCEKRIKFLTEEFQLFKIYLNTVKSRLANDETLDHKQLKTVVLASTQAQEIYAKHRKTVESILTMLTLTRKHETEEEKIFPFPVLQPEEMSRIYKIETTINYDSMSKKESYNFWLRFAQSNTKRTFLTEEIKILEREKKVLKRNICARLNMNYYLTVPDCAKIKTKNI